MATSWENLLGGYATNTLTDEEKRQLFEAALHDQTLFDALADEEALKVMLADPEARQRILANLQAAENLRGVSNGGGGWGRWFRQQSSLAWAGSIAAVGLALIFGWQMEKEWGPLVSQEQEAAQSSSNDELPFGGEKIPEDSRTSASEGALEEDAIQLEGREVERQARPEKAQPFWLDKVDRLRQVPAAEKKESDVREPGRAIRRQRANEQVTAAPGTPSVQSTSKIERPAQTLADPKAFEVPMPEETPKAMSPGRFGNQALEEFHQSNPSAQEQFYASSGFLADEVIDEKNEADRMEQRSDGAFREPQSKEKRLSSPKNKPLSFPLEREVAGGSAIPAARGIRYSFVQHTKKGKDEEVERRKIAGNGAEIRLAVETNVSGYLYVLAPLDSDNWQQLVPVDFARRNKTEAGIKVKSFQRVEFALSPLTDNSGTLVVPSLTVLISPTPLDELGQWLGREIDMTEFQIEHADGAVFVVQSGLLGKDPLRVDVPLAE